MKPNNSLDKVTYPKDLLQQLYQAWEKGQVFRDLLESFFPPNLQDTSEDSEKAVEPEKSENSDQLNRYTLEQKHPDPFDLRVPKPQQLTHQFGLVIAWVQEWESFTPGAKIEPASPEPTQWWVEFQQRANRTQGKNHLPVRVHFQSWLALARLIKKESEMLWMYRGIAKVLDRFPGLYGWIAKSPNQLFALSCDELAGQEPGFTGYSPGSSLGPSVGFAQISDPICFTRLDKLMELTQWILDNPKSGIYLRQIPLSGIDTKFIEHHRGILTQWLGWLGVPGSEIPEGSGINLFARRYGFASKPELVRFRILDSRFTLEGFSDATVPAEEFAKWSPRFVSRIFITENDVNGLAFPPVPHSLVIFGRGYSFRAFSYDHWMGNCDLLYWGDIDTHGFAILQEFRTIFPSTRSFCMDVSTLMAHKSQWGVEPSQSQSPVKNLSSVEREVYQGLLTNRWGQSLRLEQERVGFDWFQLQLTGVMRSDSP
jgi:hypothetical protein